MLLFTIKVANKSTAVIYANYIIDCVLGHKDNQKFLLNSSPAKEAAGIKLILAPASSSSSSSSSSSGGNVVGLKIPINNLNDALLANLMQNVYGGQHGVVVTEGFVRSRQLYFGTDGARGFLDDILRCTTIEARDIGEIHYFDVTTMESLQTKAEGLVAGDVNVVSTFFSQPSGTVHSDNKIPAATKNKTTFDLDKNGHVENLYLKNLLNINQLTHTNYLIVGDRNWCSETGEPIYLVLKKVDKGGTDFFVFMRAQVKREGPSLDIDNIAVKSYGEIGQICIYENMYL